VPRFHLNIFNGDGESPDEEGQVLPDLAAARSEAIRGIRSLLANELSSGAIELGGRIEIADVDGKVLQTIAFADAVEIRT
jgi:hypothetical protein